MGMIKSAVHSIQSKTPIMKILRFFLRPLLGSERIWRMVFRLPLVGHMELELPSKRKLYLETDRTDDIYKLLFWKGFEGFEIETVNVFLTLIKGKRTIIDIGASTGYYSLISAREEPGSSIYSFEPLDTAFNSFINNIEKNGIKNIRPLEMAVSDHDGRIILYVPGGDIPTSSSIVRGFRRSERQLEVETIALDHFVEKEGISEVDVIKIDIEEGEIYALKGMQRTLKEMRPLVISEVLGSERKTDIEGLLAPLDYHFYLITDNGIERKPHIEGDKVYRNYLYIPREKENIAISELGRTREA